MPSARSSDTSEVRQRLRGLSEWPLVLAAMAGGTTTIGLVTAAAGAGAVGFLAGGYRTAEGLAADMAAERNLATFSKVPFSWAA